MCLNQVPMFRFEIVNKYSQSSYTSILCVVFRFVLGDRLWRKSWVKNLRLPIYEYRPRIHTMWSRVYRWLLVEYRCAPGLLKVVVNCFSLNSLYIGIMFQCVGCRLLSYFRANCGPILGFRRRTSLRSVSKLTAVLFIRVLRFLLFRACTYRRRFRKRVPPSAIYHSAFFFFFRVYLVYTYVCERSLTS